jgi:hypothetical protein
MGNVIAKGGEYSRIELTVWKEHTSWILRLTSIYFMPPSSGRLKRLKTFSAGQNNKCNKPCSITTYISRTKVITTLLNKFNSASKAEM